MPEAVRKAVKQLNNGGLRLTWSQVAGFATFILLIGPSLLFIGTLINRVSNLERSVEVNSIARAKTQERLAVREEIDRQTLLAIKKLNERLDAHLEKEGR